MMGVRDMAAQSAIRWSALVGGAALVLALLIAIAPLLLLGAIVLLVVAWRAPHRVVPLLGHRRVAAVPSVLRATPLRFAVVVVLLTVPLAAASYAIRGEGSRGLAQPTTPTATLAAATAVPASPTPTRTATPRPTVSQAETTVRPTPTAAPTAVPTSEPTTAARGDLMVHFLDVGQGDATLLVAPDATMLIDTGRHDRDDVVPALRVLGVSEIDVVAITHGHADHIGQLDSVLASFAVDEVWMSGTPHTTQTFDRALTALEQSSADYEEPRAGETTTVGSLSVNILNPPRLIGDIDADTLALRVTYGSISFLFTGDMDADVEGRMVGAAGRTLSSTVYQVGHHGSSTSTSAALLSAVGPELAVYSASATNQYGHPHREVIRRLADSGVEIYGTATHGTVTVITDGTTYRVETGRRAAPIVPAAPQPTSAPSAAPPGSSGCGSGQVDINSAGFDELQLIIHIGPDRAQQILNLRPFSSVNSMERIDGIGPARLADIKQEGIACVP